MTNGAYFILEIEITDMAGMKPYMKKANDTVAAFGGETIIRSNNLIGVEGATPKANVVIIRFKNMQTAQAWYQSSAYQELLQYRLNSANNRSYFVEGLN